MNEFFVVRAVRRTGIGRAAAVELLGRYPGRWEIPFQEENPGAPGSGAASRPKRSVRPGGRPSAGARQAAPPAGRVDHPRRLRSVRTRRAIGADQGPQVLVPQRLQQGAGRPIRDRVSRGSDDVAIAYLTDTPVSSCDHGSLVRCDLPDSRPSCSLVFMASRRRPSRSRCRAPRWRRLRWCR